MPFVPRSNAPDGIPPPGVRVPPHSAEAERGVLGSALLDAERVLDLCVVSGLVPEAFYTPSHRILYETLQAMAHDGAAIDAVTVSDRLRAIDRLDAVGGTQALEQLIDATPTAAHAEYYIDIVRQKLLLRQVIECAQEAERSCYDGDSSADMVVSSAEQAFLSITERQHGAIVPWKTAVKETVAHLDKLFNLGPGGFMGLSTGFRDLDKMLRGMQPGQMIVLAARPSMGKTSLAMNMCECVALGQTCMGVKAKGEAGKPLPVGIFSLEMSQESLAMRMLCSRANVSRHQLDTGIGNAAEVTRRITRAASILSKAELYVDDTGGLDIAELRARARRMCRTHGVKLLMIDYLQLLNCKERSREGRQQETARISQEIKAMAKELKIPVIVLSQLSRSGEREKGSKPKLSDLRDSGAIEQDADVVMLLRRPSFMSNVDSSDPNMNVDAADKTLAIVHVAKNRNGPTEEVRMNFDAQFTRFTDRNENNFGMRDPGPSGEE